MKLFVNLEDDLIFPVYIANTFNLLMVGCDNKYISRPLERNGAGNGGEG
jgi:hypothetical protein